MANTKMHARNLLATTAICSLAVSPAFAQESEKKLETSLDAITVNATKTERLAIDSSESVSVITLEKIEETVPDSMGDLLEDIVGVEMTGGPRSTAELPSIRGLDDNRIVIRLDGARKNFDAGHRGRLFLDPELLRQVDVIRGPASTIHGSGALAGVVAMETKNASDFLKDDQTYGFRVKQGFQSNNDAWHQNYTGFGRVGSDFEGLANLSFTDTKNSSLSDDAESRTINGTLRTDSRLPNSADDIVSGMLKGKYTGFENQTITGIFTRFENDDRAFTTPDSTFTSTTRDVKRKTVEDTFTLKYEYDDGETLWLKPTVNLYYSKTEVDEDLVFGTRHEDRDLETMGIDAYNESLVTFGEEIDTIFTYGFESYRDEQVGREDGAADQNYPDSEGFFNSAYIQAETNITDAWTVTAGLRFDHYDMEASSLGEEQSDQELSPKLGVTYRPAEWISLHGLYAESFRAPSLTELFVSGVHFSVPPFVTNTFVPNPNLKPEEAESYEIGVGLSFDNVLLEEDALRAKTTVFHTDYKNFIQQSVASTTTTTDNVPDAEIRGFELEAEYVTRMPFVQVGYHQYRGKDKTNEISLNDIPTDTLTVEFGSRIPAFDLKLGSRVEFAQRQERSGTESASAGFTVADLYASWKPSEQIWDGKLEGLRVDAGIDNVFDKHYQRHLSNLPEEGVNYKISAAYTVAF